MYVINECVATATEICVLDLCCTETTTSATQLEVYLQVATIFSENYNIVGQSTCWLAYRDS
jgi:hypothetical protein